MKSTLRKTTAVGRARARVCVYERERGGEK